MHIDNKSRLLIEDIFETITDKSVVKLCVDYASINALFSIIEKFKHLPKLQILINEQKFSESETLFINDAEEKATHLKLESYFRLNKVSEFANSKIEFKKNVTGGNRFIIIDQKVYQISPNDFNEATLGIVKDAKPYLIIPMDDSQGALNMFTVLWDSGKDCKEEILSLYQNASPLQYPEMVYKYTISKIFENKNFDDLNNERLTRTGFKGTKVWNMLFNFQRDAVLGAIDKIEKYGGCIIADSVGLGKTFEALAVMKYYELRNDRVLVLAPKKLRDNWLTYRINDVRNILNNDRFNYDVLNHTDLSRDKGLSGDINLETVNWGNYDLLVIDESHNFRNNKPAKDRRTRYQKLMEDIILSGVKTKVLLLSATPVNTGLNDLRNQLKFITEGDDEVLKADGISSIDLTLSQAQRAFNKWMKEENPTRDDLVNRLRGDYFKLLDIYTISRSRKHIEKYYDVADLGKFPTRLKPISINSDFDRENKNFSITDINDELEKLELKFYSPTYFLLDHVKEQYAEKYDTVTGTGSVFKQIDREEGLITLMRVNLLKRLESSIHSFRLTLQKILNNIDGILEQIDNYREYSTDLDVRDFDFDDEELSDLFIGKSVKVLLQDLDRIKFKEFLNFDRKILVQLIKEIEEITAQRDQKKFELLKLIENKIQNPINPGNKKVIVFSAFADTIKYLYKECAPLLDEQFGVKSAMVVGSDANKTNLKSIRNDLQSILINFSPQSKSRKELFPKASEEIDILFCTDCISEGQNLQDCDYLVNYDIHWNPVRIIQRFGRIDRIGTTNTQIQLVNFYPNVDLDQYINLIQRVKGRMQMVDITTTGEDNVIDENTDRKELDYRRRQLEKLRETVVDIEDLEGGISITDLTFNDFKVDADRITKTEEEQFSKLASGVFSLVDNTIIDQASGILFCLKDTDNTNSEEKLRANLLHPYSLMYISYENEAIIPIRMGKKSLDLFKKLSYGKLGIKKELLKKFNGETKSGRYMSKYADLLKSVQMSIEGEEKEVAQNSIFNPEGSIIGKDAHQGDYEIVSYLIVY